MKSGKVRTSSMAMNKVMQLALKAVSYRDINVKKNYKVVRKLIDITHPAYGKKHYKSWDHKVILKDHEIPVRIFSVDTSIRPVLIFFHGGGWVTGNIDSYTKTCANLATVTGHVVVSVDYRLAPEHKFPAAPEDCYYVTKEIYLKCEELFGVPASKVSLIGDSAGANLAAVVSLMARDRNEFEVTRQILIYPAVNNDFTEHSIYPSVQMYGTDYLLTSKRMCDYLELYQSKEEDRFHPYFAPILANDLTDQPVTMVITAEYDPLRDEGEAYGKKLLDAGSRVSIHRIEGVMHGFFVLPINYQPVADCYELIREFLEKEEMI